MTQMAPSGKQPREFTGRHMLMLVTGFFGIVIAVNLVLAYFASSTWTGLLAKNGYVASQDYNHVLEAAARQRQTGWHSNLALVAGGLEFVLQDASSRPLDVFAVTASIGRRTNEGEDRDLELTGAGGGRYVYDGAIAPGAWRAEVVARDGGQLRYRRIFDFTVTRGG